MRLVLMKSATILSLTVFVMAIINSYGQASQPAYDEEVAKSLGADAYGMKGYVLAILKTGPTEIKDEETTTKLFRGHLENISRLAEEGKLVVAGPLAKNDKEYRGIFIMNVPTVAEAEALVETDPAIKAGVLPVELYGWYGSAALPVYLETHNKIEKHRP